MCWWRARRPCTNACSTPYCAPPCTSSTWTPSVGESCYLLLSLFKSKSCNTCLDVNQTFVLVCFNNGKQRLMIMLVNIYFLNLMYVRMAVWYIDILGNIVVIQSNCFGEIQTNQSIKKENQGWRNDNNSKKHQTCFLAFVPCGSGRVLNRFSKDMRWT